MSWSRIIPFEGIYNFRRFGAYHTKDGKVIKDHLYRSGQFSRASDDDKAKLNELGIKTVVDLRRPSERKAEPSFWSESMGVTVIENGFGGPAEAPHLQFLREEVLTFESIRTFMTQTYRRLPFDEGNQYVFREGFKALAAQDECDGFIIHCAAGKDRTGIFCALLLWELGVDDQTVTDDYLMTNTAVDFDLIARLMGDRLEKKYNRKLGEDELKAFLGVEESYLNTALEVMGEPRKYLREALKLDDAVLNQLHERLLA